MVSKFTCSCDPIGLWDGVDGLFGLFTLLKILVNKCIFILAQVFKMVVAIVMIRLLSLNGGGKVSGEGVEWR